MAESPWSSDDLVGDHWVEVNCSDRAGILAEVSSMITAQGLMIKSHSGGAVNEETGQSAMRFALIGTPSAIGRLCRDVQNVRGVTSWSTGCLVVGMNPTNGSIPGTSSSSSYTNGNGNGHGNGNGNGTKNSKIQESTAQTENETSATEK